MSWFVCLFADGNKTILQRLSSQQENVKGAVKQVLSEAGIQSSPVPQQYICEQNGNKLLIQAFLRTTFQKYNSWSPADH